MKKKMLLLLMLSSCALFGQAHKHIVKYFPKSKEISEDYYVLKKDKKIYDGSYISYFYIPEGTYQRIKQGNAVDSFLVKEKGFYKNGLKDSSWIEYSDFNYSDESKYIKSKEFYKNGNKKGIWQTYIENGQIIKQYDYDNKKPLPYLSNNVSEYIIYPEKSREGGKQGIEIVEYSIENDCSIDSFKVIQSVSTDCDKEVITDLKALGEKQKAFKLKYNIPCTPQQNIQVKVNFVLR